MVVYVVTKEEQSDMGYIDTGIVGVFRSKEKAALRALQETQTAQLDGKIVAGVTEEDDWDVNIDVTGIPVE